MKEFLDLLKNKKNRIGLLVLGLLIFGITAGVYLVRQQQIIKSKATESGTRVEVVDLNGAPIPNNTTTNRNVQLKIFYTP